MITVRTNINEVIASMNGKIESFYAGASGYDSLVRTVATSLLPVIKTRIHEEGMAADGTTIGTYSTKPTYVSTSTNVGKSFGRPIGKTGKSKFATGEKAGMDHTSRYFPGGYAEYKTTIGRNTLGTVNLSLSGQMNQQFTVVPTEKGYGLGWNEPHFALRARYFEKKYQKQIYGLTTSETDLVITVAKSEFSRAFS